VVGVLGRGCVVGVDGFGTVVVGTGITPVGVVTTGKVVTGFDFAEA
jgi:hypothetical protein